MCQGAGKLDRAPARPSPLYGIASTFVVGYGRGLVQLAHALVRATTHTIAFANRVHLCYNVAGRPDFKTKSIHDSGNWQPCYRYGNLKKSSITAAHYT